jgi:K+-transporting ATPase KdpF subunit
MRPPAAGAQGAAVSVWLWISLALALGVFVYVVYALLKAEDFS